MRLVSIEYDLFTRTHYKQLLPAVLLSLELESGARTVFTLSDLGLLLNKTLKQ